MILSKHYLPAIKELKKGESVWIEPTEKAMLMAQRIMTTGQVEWRSLDMSSGRQHFLVPIAGTVAKYMPEQPDTVKVSFWQSGARAGMFSQKAYTVLDRTPERVQVELMPNMPKWFPVGQVQAA